MSHFSMSHFHSQLLCAGALFQEQQDQPGWRLQANAERGRPRVPVARERHQRAEDRPRDGHQIHGLRAGASLL